MFYCLSAKPKSCVNYETQITCEGTVANITCPDLMSIFIVDAYYGRTDRDE